MINNRHPKKFIIVPILATIAILSALFFQYTGHISPATTSLVTVVTVVIFFPLEYISRKRFLKKRR